MTTIDRTALLADCVSRSRQIDPHSAKRYQFHAWASFVRGRSVEEFLRGFWRNEGFCRTASEIALDRWEELLRDADALALREGGGASR